MRVLFLLSLLSLSLTACNKKGPEVFSATPQIMIESVEPTTVKQFIDSLVVILAYQDGDGDLGFVHPDSLSLRVKDARLTAPDWYFVQPLAPVGEAIAIEGQLRFTIKGAFLLSNAAQESTTYTIDIKDRAGNWSNTTETSVITITK